MIRKWIVYFALLLLSTLSAVFLDSTVGYAPLYLILALTALSLLYTLVTLFCVRCTGTQKDMVCLLQTPAKMTFEIRNRSFLFIPHACARFLSEGEPKSEDFSLFPLQSRQIETELSFAHIGIFRAGIRSIRFYDLLGVFRLRRGYRQQTVTVAPRLFSITGVSLVAGPAPQGTRRDYFDSHPEEERDYNGVRNYVPGDSIKNIHWPLTAHTSGMMSKNYETCHKNGLCVFLDLTPPSYGGEAELSVFDCLAEAAFAALTPGAASGVETRLLYTDAGAVHNRRVGNMAEIHRIAPLFAFLSFQSGCDCTELIKNGLQNYSSCKNIIVCTSVLSDDLAGCLAGLQRIGVHTLLIDAVPDLEHRRQIEDKIRYLSAQGIDCRVIRSAGELEAMPVEEQIAASAGWQT